MSTLLVASTGGHLKQLHRLHRRLTGVEGPYRWATFDTPQSRSLLEGETVDFVHFVGGRDPVNLFRNLPAARRILADRELEAVVSTGSSMALPFIALARAQGRECHYIESAARSEGPSVTGRVIGRIPGVWRYAQYPSWGRRGWHHRGSVFDSFAPVAEPERQPGALGRVVVTLGTYRGYGFTRLIRRLQSILPPEAEVLWQTGDTDTGGLGIDGHYAIPEHDLNEAMREADVVVAHAGVGAALAAFEAGKCPVLVPRRHALGEHVDDHQTQIATELGDRGLSVSVEADDLTLETLHAAATRPVRTLAAEPPFVTGSARGHAIGRRPRARADGARALLDHEVTLRPHGCGPGHPEEVPVRVLVTGHNGYIGSVLVPRFEQAGHEVVGLDSDLFAACTFGPDVPEVELGARTDVRDVESEDLVGFDAVIHLAAVCNDPVGDLNPQATYDINHLASVRVAEKAKQAGVTRFLFSSSCSLYGKAGDEMLDEGAGFAPVTPYGQSKVLAERDISALADELFQPDLPAQRDRLRRLAATARRRRRQQPGRIRAHHGRGPDPERRDTLATARTRRGHRQRLPRRARGPARARPRRGVQRRRELRELPDPGPGRDRRGGRPRGAGVVRAERWRTGQALLPGRLLEDRRGSCPAFTPQWTVRRGVEELYDAYVSATGSRFEEFTGTAVPEDQPGPRAPGGGPARRRAALAAAGRRALTG